MLLEISLQKSWAPLSIFISLWAAVIPNFSRSREAREMLYIIATYLSLPGANTSLILPNPVPIKDQTGWAGLEQGRHSFPS